jgi:deoxyribose-phosphate aldolase
MLASLLDSTNLKPDAKSEDIRNLCEKAVFYGMAAVCVNPYRTALASQILKDYKVKVCTVVGFPLGAAPAKNKVNEARQALEDGASELDVVINIGAVKDGDYHIVSHEINQLLQLKKEYDYLLKVIVETALLTDTELKQLVKIINDSGADFIKTSTGFASRGVSLEDVMTIIRLRRADLKIKASGGIKTLDFALQLINLGVDRIGSSNCEKLMEAWHRLQFQHP